MQGLGAWHWSGGRAKDKQQAAVAGGLRGAQNRAEDDDRKLAVRTAPTTRAHTARARRGKLSELPAPRRR